VPSVVTVCGGKAWFSQMKSWRGADTNSLSLSLSHSHSCCCCYIVLAQLLGTNITMATAKGQMASGARGGAMATLSSGPGALCDHCG
jgi:hypothetical protein